MPEKVRVTYATMSADNEDLHADYERGLQTARSWLGQKHQFYVNGEAREGEGYDEERSPIDRDVVTVVLADTLTKAERSLADSGKADTVLSTRQQFQRVMREDPDGSMTVVANNFQGKRLLRPNDVIVKSDGAIYFTDPGGPLAPDQFDVTVAGVYRVSADLGTISLIVDDLIGPNGLAFSPDEAVLYVNDARRRIVRAYDLLPNGTVAKQTSRLFADMGGPEPGVPDGMKVDTAGNVYTGGAGGLYIMDKTGKKLGRIVHGLPATTNIAFGGDDWKTLYFTTRSSLNMVNVKIAGVPVPAKKKT